jgi:hypothetical protein
MRISGWRRRAAALAIAATAGAAAGGCEAGTSGPAGSGARAEAQSLAALAHAGEKNARRLDAVEQGLETRDGQIRELRAALAERDDRIAELARAAGDLSARLDALVKKQGGETQALEQDLARLAGREAELRARIEEVQRVIEAFRRASLLANVERDVPKIDGKVILVERASDGATVLLDVGIASGVKPSYEFTLARAGKPIAKVVVDHVEAQVASARVVSIRDGEQVREGDLATTRP